MCGYLWEGGEWRRLKWGNIVDGLHILRQNRTMKLLAIPLSGVGRSWGGRDGGGEITNVQHKPIQNFHNESLLYNKYILIKNFKKKCIGNSKVKKMISYCFTNTMTNIRGK
jgi:hypothetical protein